MSGLGRRGFGEGLRGLGEALGFGMGVDREGALRGRRVKSQRAMAALTASSETSRYLWLTETSEWPKAHLRTMMSLPDCS